METMILKNVNEGLYRAYHLFRGEKAREIAPRGLKTIEISEPVATIYQCPAEMVLFDTPVERFKRDSGECGIGWNMPPFRDANPFFHFFEALWILQGREDVGFLKYFLPRMADFSDDGVKFHAPYGYRLRHGFGLDQIETAVQKLRDDHDTRQAVLSIWHPDKDWQTKKDIPCNDLIMLKIREGKLRMTVCNRSNDVVLGLFGANVVQFSTLLKYMAGRIGVGIGTYTQVSDSFHVYVDNPYYKACIDASRLPVSVDMYKNPSIDRSANGWDDEVTQGECDYMPPSELSSGVFDDDLYLFFELWDVQDSGIDVLNPDRYASKSFKHTVIPLLETLSQWRASNRDEALARVKTVAALDWRVAAEEWMLRRINKLV